MVDDHCALPSLVVITSQFVHKIKKNTWSEIECVRKNLKREYHWWSCYSILLAYHTFAYRQELGVGILDISLTIYICRCAKALHTW